MRTLVVIEAEVGGEWRLRLLQCNVFLGVHLLVLHAAPKPFGEDIVLITALAIHADSHARCLQHGGECIAGELRALIGVVDVRLPPACDSPEMDDACKVRRSGASPPRSFRLSHAACNTHAHDLIPAICTACTHLSADDPSPHASNAQIYSAFELAGQKIILDF